MRPPHARPITPTEPVTRETLAEDLLGASALVVIFVVLFILLPVLA